MKKGGIEDLFLILGMAFHAGEGCASCDDPLVTLPDYPETGRRVCKKVTSVHHLRAEHLATRKPHRGRSCARPYSVAWEIETRRRRRRRNALASCAVLVALLGAWWHFDGPTVVREAPKAWAGIVEAWKTR